VSVPVPRISVVIPTYNHSELLAQTLHNLTRQDLPTSRYEVVVADDGSADDTRDVVRSFAGRLRIGYHFQEDLGFRAAAARNGGARVASAPLLAFLDTGSMVGPSFVSRHLAAHDGGPSGRAVLGLSYGYNPEDPIEGVDEALLTNTPEAVVARYGDDPAFQDIRHPDFVDCGFDLDRRAVPWMLFWTGNCSVAAADFWRVGGFDEDFNGWGGEDIDLGFRLHRAGLRLRLAPDIWAVVAPHDRDTSANDEALKTNVTRFLHKFPEPIVEIGWGVVAKYLIMPWEMEYRRLLDWQEKVHDLDVADEIAALARDVRPGERVAVLGCGSRVPADLGTAVLVEFDEQQLRAASTGTHHIGHHAVGIRTVLPDRAVDTVLVTSRLAGLWETWGDLIRQEAARIGRRTLTSPDLG
jgi:GT2 family glycosyltransferase